MHDALIKLIRDSDLEFEKIEELLEYYKHGDKSEFLGRAFLYSVVKYNKQKKPAAIVDPIDDDLQHFK